MWQRGPRAGGGNRWLREPREDGHARLPVSTGWGVRTSRLQPAPCPRGPGPSASLGRWALLPPRAPCSLPLVLLPGEGLPVPNPQAPGAGAWLLLRTQDPRAGRWLCPRGHEGPQGASGHSRLPMLGGLPRMFWASGQKTLPCKLGGHTSPQPGGLSPVSLNLHLPRVFWEGPGDSRSAQGVGPGSHWSAPGPEPRPQRPQARAGEEAGSQLRGHMPEGLNAGVTRALTCDVHAFVRILSVFLSHSVSTCVSIASCRTANCPQP